MFQARKRNYRFREELDISKRPKSDEMLPSERDKLGLFVRGAAVIRRGRMNI